DRKKIDDSKKYCLDVSKRKESAIEIIQKFTEIIDSENLLRFLPDEIGTVKKLIEDCIKGFAKLEPQIDAQIRLNGKYKDEIDSKDAELAGLQSKVSRLKSAVEAREDRLSAINGLKETIVQLEEGKDTIGSKIRMLETGIPSLQHEIASMQDELETNNGEVEKLAAERVQLTSDLESSTNESNDLGNSGGRKSDLDEMEKRAIQLKKDKVAAGYKISKQESEIEFLRQETSSMQEKCENNKEETVNLDNEKSRLVSDLKSLTNEANDLEGSGGRKSDLDGLVRGNTRLKRDVDAAISKTRKQESEIESLKQETSSMHEKHAEDRDETEKLYSAKTQLSSDLESLIMAADDLENSGGKKSALDELEKKIIRLNIDKDTIESKTGKQDAEIESLKVETASMRAGIENDQEETETLSSGKDQLTSDIEFLANEIKSLEDSNIRKSDLDKLTVGNSKVEKKNNALKEDVDRANQLKSQTGSSTYEINKEIENIQNVINDLNNKADSLSQSGKSQEEIDKLQIEYKAVLKERDELDGNMNGVELEFESVESTKREIENTGNEFESLQNEFNEFKEKVDQYENNPEQFKKLKNNILELSKMETEFMEKTVALEQQLSTLTNQGDVAAMKMKGYKEPLDEIANMLKM
ncbi:MAG: hypothetical protein ACUZ8H_12975, partial [Candidatus Anammoxibacter sp.]